MNKLLIFLPFQLLIILLFYDLTTYAQWENVSDPGMAYDATVSIDSSGSDIWWAGLHSGMWKSSDNGNTWSKVNYNSSAAIRDIAVTGNTIAVADFVGSKGQLNISYDKGESWIKKDTLARSSVEIYNDIIVSGSGIGSGLIISDDLGNSWFSPDTSETGRYISSIKIVPGKIYAATNKGLIVSSDTGRTWTSKSMSHLPSPSRMLEYFNSSIYLGTQNGLYSSNDDGETWKDCNTGLPEFLNSPIREVTSLAQVGNDLFLGSYGKGVFISRDGGGKWYSANKRLEDSIFSIQNVPAVYSVHSANGYLYAGTYKGYGVYRRPLKDFEGLFYEGGGWLVAPYIEGAQYQWYLNDKLLSESTHEFLATYNGIYKVVISYNENLRISSPTKITSRTYEYEVEDLIILGIEDFTEVDNIDIYPNPSSGIVNFKPVSDNSEGTLSITDVSGSIVLNESISNGMVQLRLKSGVYMCRFADKNGVYIRKIVIY